MMRHWMTAWLLLGLVLGLAPMALAVQGEPRGVAVLTFENLTGDPERETELRQALDTLKDELGA